MPRDIAPLRSALENATPGESSDVYQDRDEDRYRDLLRTLFVRFEDWDAYDELRAACSDDQWETTCHGLVTQLGRLAPERLVDLYLHEGEREKALAKALDSDDLAMLRQYRDELADLDPEAYFAAYRDVLAPYLAAETGRDHYRTVIEHLREMDAIGLDDRMAEFVADLRETHSNRPALLDELDTAGF